MKKYFYLAVMIVAIGILYQCTVRKQLVKAPAAVADANSSPVVAAEESIGKMKLEPGFTAKLVAAEPLVSI